MLMLTTPWHGPALADGAGDRGVTARGGGKARRSVGVTGRRRRARGRRRRRRGPIVSARYRRQRRAWHRRAPRGVLKRWLARERPPLVLKPIHRHGSVSLRPEPDGTFCPEDVERARGVLAPEGDAGRHRIHPRLLEVVYRAVLHFEVPYVHIISAYRNTRLSSRHAQGRAVDLVLPGVSDRGLAKYLRRQGFVGVGLYPVSGFVHLDVRERSYFWIDRSGPGRRGRPRGIMARHALRFDRQARKRGEIPVPPFSPGGPQPP